MKSGDRTDDVYDPLIEVFASDVALTTEQIAFIKTLFVPRRYRKGEFYQRAGQVTTHGAFVVHGCFRTYSIDPAGLETIIHFSPEGAWIGNIASAIAGTPTPFFVDAIEPSTVLLIDLASFERLHATIPALRDGYQRALQRSQGAKERRIAMALSSTAEERYADFMARHPTVAARVPQRMLASYLGITPETLSRLRKKLSEGRGS